MMFQQSYCRTGFGPEAHRLSQPTKRNLPALIEFILVRLAAFLAFSRDDLTFAICGKPIHCLALEG